MTRAVFLDVESTGLNTKQGSILEIALIVVEVPRLIEVARTSFVCRPVDVAHLTKMDPIVVKMHTESGLLAEVARATRTAAQVEPELCVWFLNQTGGEKVYLAGSNPDFDRRWLEEHMPNLARKLHYRNFDVNTFFILREWISSKEKQGTRHRALADCEQAIQGVRDHLNWCARVFGARPPKTQRERATAALGAQDWAALEMVVAEAQNAPPEGAADGTLPPILWYAFRDALAAAKHWGA